jgi:ribosomal protein S18 acetylase RimI-like enzyme
MRITRRLNPGEGHLFKAVRLEALRESPEAFSSRYEEAVARSDESWADQADSSAVGPNRATFVTLDDQPVGLAALYRHENAPDVGELVQMWIAPDLRGGSVANDLLRCVFQWASSQRVAFVKAEVMKSNARALRFYEKFGFSISADHDTESSVLLTKAVEQDCTGQPGPCADAGSEGGDESDPVSEERSR